MDHNWELTYNLVLCAIAFPMLAFFGGKWIKSLDAKITKMCKAITELHEKLDQHIEKLEGKKRSKEMCDEKMRSVYVEQEYIKGELKDIREIIAERG